MYCVCLLYMLWTCVNIFYLRKPLFTAGWPGAKLGLKLPQIYSVNLAEVANARLEFIGFKVNSKAIVVSPLLWGEEKNIAPVS